MKHKYPQLLVLIPIAICFVIANWVPSTATEIPPPLDPATLFVRGTFSVSRPIELAVSPDAQSLYVLQHTSTGSQSAVVVVDTSTYALQSISFGIGTLLAIVSWAAVVSIFGLLPDEMASAGFLERMWFGLMSTLDAGTMGGDAGGWPFLVANLGITLGGVFIVSALIGVLNNGLEARLDGLRKGRSKVIESDHTVILGWGPAVFTIIEELATANENKRDACIVILSETDKVTMEDAVRERVPDTKTTRVV